MNQSVKEWFESRTGLGRIFHKEMVEYRVPKGLTLPYSLGMLAVLFFVIQIISGIFVLMYYKPDAKLAFDSVNYTIVQVVPWGWFLRSLHAVGAGFFMAIIYTHMFTGVYYNAYKNPRQLIWITGWVIYMVMILLVLTGYLLPQGQLSYWASEVVSEMPTAIPLDIMDKVSLWIKGGFSVGDITITRFFALHVVLLPLLLIVLVFLHMQFFHQTGVTSADGREVHGNEKETVPFIYVTLKEGVIIAIVLAAFSYFIFFNPAPFTPSANFAPADPMRTPAHIAPEWYLTAFYEIFRSIPGKFLGFMATNMFLIFLLLLPILDTSKKKSATKRPLFYFMYLLFLLSFAVLSIEGTQPDTAQSIVIGQVFFFINMLFFVSLPVIAHFEKKKEAIQ